MLGILRLGAVAAVAALLAAGLPVAVGAESPVVLLGIDAAGAAELAQAGQNAPLASYWVGDWIASSGWGGVENMLKASVASGRTPVLYWYYWGDSISPSCVENGCNGRNKAEWNALTDGLETRVRDIMKGAPVYIVLENEFNKGGITDTSYAPTFDRYLEEKAIQLKGVSGVKIVLGYGSWGESSWNRFPRAIAASDAIGFQIMRANTRDTEAFYRASDDKIASVLAFVQTLSPGKGALLYDLALSSYPDSNWVTAQKETLEDILARRAEYAANGLMGIVYRTVRDNPNMSPSNYYGYAEQHWGLKKADGTAKPSLAVWAGAFTGSPPPAPTPTPTPTPTPAPSIPASFEGESMTATKGGRATDASASGGALWNLWSNGELSQAVNSSGGTYRVAIAARGPSAGGIAPIMALKLNDVTLQTWSVTTALATYAQDVVFPAGTSKLAVAFTNDALIGTEDRNLLVDVVRVADAPAPNRAPTAAFDVAGSYLTWTFDARASSDPDGDALTYAWSFGGSEAIATRDFPAGAQSVTLTVTDTSGLTASATRTFTAVQPNRAPTARIVASGANDTWTFDAGGSTDPDGDALAYAWTFPDGTTATGARVTRAFAAGSQTVQLVATDPAGLSGSASATVSSVKPAPVPAPVPTAFLASFTNVKGNDWWVEVTVSANKPLTGVCASVDGATCKPLALKSWGSWAASFYVKPGSDIRFRANAGDESVTSGAYDWPSGTPVTASPTPPAVKFTPYDGNANWVQTRVETTAKVTAVCASLNGGACKTLTWRSWGAWAAGISAPAGTKVVFTATLGDGTQVRSASYTWPVK